MATRRRYTAFVSRAFQIFAKNEHEHITVIYYIRDLIYHKDTFVKRWMSDGGTQWPNILTERVEILVIICGSTCHCQQIDTLQIKSYSICAWWSDTYPHKHEQILHAPRNVSCHALSWNALPKLSKILIPNLHLHSNNCISIYPIWLDVIQSSCKAPERKGQQKARVQANAFDIGKCWSIKWIPPRRWIVWGAMLNA